MSRHVVKNIGDELLRKHVDRVPVLLTISDNGSDKRLLVEKHMTLDSFLCQSIRQFLPTTHMNAVYLMLKRHEVELHLDKFECIADVYKKHRDDDSLLRLHVMNMSCPDDRSDGWVLV